MLCVAFYSASPTLARSATDSCAVIMSLRPTRTDLKTHMTRPRSLFAPLCVTLLIGCSPDSVTSSLKPPGGLSRADVVATCDNLQASLTASSEGDVIIIPSGSVCVGHYDLPSHAITLMGELPAGATFDGEGEHQILAGHDVGGLVIRNLTFKNGLSSEDGGAIHISGSSAPVISGCTFINNEADDDGGAVAFFVEDGMIEHSTFLGNTGSSGGAVFMRSVLWTDAGDGGDLTLRDNVFGSAGADRNSAAGEGGGAYLSTFGQAVVTGNRFDSNSAHGGGGIFVRAPAGVFTANTLSSNSAAGPGGGAFIESRSFDFNDDPPATFTLDANIIKNNTSLDQTICDEELCRGGGGGGLYLYQLVAEGTNNTVSGNSAPSGGGIFIDRARLKLTGSTVSSNVAALRGGGIRANGDLLLTNSTISSNSADVGGGIYIASGDYNFDGDGTLLNTTIADNRAASGSAGGLANYANVTVTNSIFARNLGAGALPGNCGPGSEGDLTGGPPLSGGHNLEDADTCGFSTSPNDGDIVGQNALLGPLADNGGQTFTHALLAGSPAIDAANNALCPAVDQRGQSRPKDGNGDRAAVCDIGSYELEANAPPPATTGLDTKHLRINFGSHGGENAIDWSATIGFPSGDAINPVTEAVTIRLVSGGVDVFKTMLAPGSFVREPDGSYRYRSPKGARPELDIRFKPRADGTYDFKIGVDEVSPSVRDRSAVEGTISVGTRSVAQTLPLTDKGKLVEYKK